MRREGVGREAGVPIGPFLVLLRALVVQVGEVLHRVDGDEGAVAEPGVGQVGTETRLERLDELVVAGIHGRAARARDELDEVPDVLRHRGWPVWASDAKVRKKGDE